MVKNPPAVKELQETWLPSLCREDPLEEGMATHSVFLPGESHGQRSLAGNSPWGHKDSDTTEAIAGTHIFYHKFTINFLKERDPTSSLPTLILTTPCSMALSDPAK